MKFIWISLLMTFLCSQFCWTQYHFSGVITNKKKEKMDAVQIALTECDTLRAMTLTDAKGAFDIGGLGSGEYTMHINYLGYTPVDEKLFIRGRDVKMNFILLSEMTGILSEVEVTANRNDKVERTATGQVFYLSEQAKNSGNPYRALMEVPKLITDEVSQTIKTEDGSSPLILINGNRVNSGVNPIDPKEIESVEVIDVVSARYLKSGVKKIVNIKLKKKSEPYKYFEVMNRHDIPIRLGMGAVYFEVGNPQCALYGRFAGDYTYNDDADMESLQQNEGYRKEMTGISRDNRYSGLGELQFRWMCTDKDYLVAYIYGNTMLKKGKTWGDGVLESVSNQSFSYDTRNKDKSYIITSSLFYKHTFAPENTLETTFDYNKNNNKNDGVREETYSDRLYLNNYEYDNDRASYKLNIDYSYTWNKINSLNIGSITHFIDDRLHRVSDNYPPFLHKEWNEYLYAGFSSKIKNFSYMVSVGAEGLWLKADAVSNHYFKPRASVSGTYTFNDHHSMEIDYQLRNTAPSVEALNPYNTSTDSLVITKGNPYLLPAQNHQFGISYSFNYKGFYISPSFNYLYNTDLIEPYGYTEKGIYVSSYKNSNTYKYLSVGGHLNYRMKWGNVYGGAYHNVDYFSGQDPKNSFNTYLGFMARYKKFSFYVEADYTNYTYTSVSRTRQYAPVYSHIQATYNFTKLFYISVAFTNCMGYLRSATTTDDAGYHGYTYRRMKDQSFCPWILIRYTFRKNGGRKIKENKLLQSTEQGISL